MSLRSTCRSDGHALCTIAMSRTATRVDPDKSSDSIIVKCGASDDKDAPVARTNEHSHNVRSGESRAMATISSRIKFSSSSTPTLVRKESDVNLTHRNQ